jgi:hypothetical protein
MKNPYSFEEVVKILTTTGINKTAEELGRTYAATVSIRNKYSKWKRKGADLHNKALLVFYKKFDEEKLQVSSLKKGRVFGFSPKKIVTEENREEIEEKKIQSPDVAFEKVFSSFKKDIEQLMLEMAQKLFLEYAENQYKETTKMVAYMSHRQFKKMYKKTNTVEQEVV